jgi:predicted phage tail protein
MGQETSFQNFVAEIRKLQDTINAVCKDLKDIFEKEGGKFFSLLLVKGAKEGIEAMEAQGKSFVEELKDLRQFEEEWRRAEEGRRKEILSNKANEIKNRGKMIMKLAELALGKDVYEMLFGGNNKQQ